MEIGAYFSRTRVRPCALFFWASCSGSVFGASFPVCVVFTYLLWAAEIISRERERARAMCGGLVTSHAGARRTSLTPSVSRPRASSPAPLSASLSFALLSAFRFDGFFFSRVVKKYGRVVSFFPLCDAMQ